MSIQIVIYILFVHWLADFVAQTDKEAKGKSKELKYLLSHTIPYSISWLPAFMFYQIFIDIINFPNLQPNFLTTHQVMDFIMITFFCHTITDYFTSRLNAKLWEQGKVHNFFVSVGFDQFLHFAQLLITFHLLTK